MKILQYVPDWMLSNFGKKLRDTKQMSLHQAAKTATNFSQLFGLVALMLILVWMAWLILPSSIETQKEQMSKMGVEVQATAEMTGLFRGHYQYEYEGVTYTTSDTYTITPFFCDTVIVNPILPNHITPTSFELYLRTLAYAFLYGLTGYTAYIIILSLFRYRTLAKKRAEQAAAA